MIATQLVRIHIAKDFSDTPGGRYRTDGEASGEEFRETQLKPRFLQAQKDGTALEIDLDGAEGYATSFLEEAFGGLAREFGAQQVMKTLKLSCKDEPMLVKEIHSYIEAAK